MNNFIIIFAILFVFRENAFAFLLGNSSNVPNAIDSTYHLLTLLVQEQNEREHLEQKVNTLTKTFEEFRANSTKALEQKVNTLTRTFEEFRANATKEITKGIYNRQQLHDTYSRLDNNYNNVLEDQQELHEKLQNISIDLQTIDKRVETLQIGLNDLSKNVTDLAAVSEVTSKQVNDVQNKYDGIVATVGLLSKSITENYQETATLNNSMVTIATNLNLLNTSLQSINQISEQAVGFSVSEPFTNITQGRPIFKTVHYNYHKTYNNILREFECNVSGLYFFIATVVKTPGSNEAYCCVYKRLANGTLQNQVLCTVSTGFDDRGYLTGTANLLMLLNAGEGVYLECLPDFKHFHSYSSFTGFLVQHVPK